jgi:hypothetical protein
MQITEGELASMTRQLDDMHSSTFPSVRKALGEFADDLSSVRSAALSRRGVLSGVGGLLALGTLTACGASQNAVTAPSPGAPSPGSPLPGSPTPSTSGGASIYTGDFKVVALAAALENLAVAAYGGALKKAAAGSLGTVPPAIATFITTVRKQHADHAAAWNAVLTKATLPPISGTPLTNAASTVAALNKVTTVPQVAKLALALENGAADTYTSAVGSVKNAAGIMIAATIQPVEAMHAAILHFVLGQYPVPDSFIGVADAASTDQLTK